MPAQRACICLACAALFAACTGQPTVAEYAPPTAMCCSSIAEFAFRPLPPGQEVELSLSPREATYEFSGRRQHFIALKIPDGFTASTIQVRSFLSTGFLPKASAVIPYFVYLGPDFRELAKSSTGNFQAAGGFWRSGISGRAVVPAAARYIVVIAGDGSDGLPIVYSENRTPYRIPAAALGEFSLRLFGETAK